MNVNNGGNTYTSSKSNSFTNSSTNTSTKGSNNTNSSTNTSTKIDAALKDSVIGSGSLSQSTTNTATNTTEATGGAGSAFNTATVSGNKIKYAAAGFSGNVAMINSMGGQGILQANQNTGANATQQNSVALTSSVGGNGGGLSGFSPSASITPAAR